MNNITMGRDEKATFSMVPHSLLDSGVSPTAIALYAYLAKFADNETREAYPARVILAEALRFSKAASVDRYVKELVDAGFITVSAGWRQQGRRRSDAVSLTRDDAHTVRTSNTFRLVIPLSFSGDGGSPQKGTGVVPKKGQELEPCELNPIEGLKDLGAAQAPTAQKTITESISKNPTWKTNLYKDAPSLIPEDWKPNHTHHVIASRLGIDIQDAEQCFYKGMDEADQHRGNWDRTFGSFLNATADGREDIEFPCGHVEAVEMEREYEESLHQPDAVGGMRAQYA